MSENRDKSNPKYDIPPAKLPEGGKMAQGVRIVSGLAGAQVVTKPWGRETILSQNAEYTFKKIEIKAGFETSLQYHHRKSETIIFVSGNARVVFEDESGALRFLDMEPGSIFETRPPAIHRVVAVTDISYYEASTPDPNGLDVIRLRDSFQRKDGRLENEYK
ncbi:MAG: cupin domain-containing protein [Candidatus Micrarchaeia archaeon]